MGFRLGVAITIAVPGAWRFDEDDDDDKISSRHTLTPNNIPALSGRGVL